MSPRQGQACLRLVASVLRHLAYLNLVDFQSRAVVRTMPHLSPKYAQKDLQELQLRISLKLQEEAEIPSSVLC